MPDAGAPDILITGTYCSLNRGDASMQIVCAAGLRARLPGARIAIHAPFPDIDGPFYERRGLPVVPSTRRRLVRGTAQWARLAMFGGGRASLDDDYPPARESDAIARADLVVDLSGDMLTEDYGVHVAYSHYLPLLQALAADRRLALCAQSVGPFRYTGWLARRIFDGAELVTVRESTSLDHLESLGARPGRVELTADLAFALAPASPDEVDAALESEGLDGDEAWIGVSLSSLVEDYRKRTGRSSGTLTEELVPALRAVSARADARVLLVPHVYGPGRGKDDRRALTTLKAALGEGAILLDKEHDPEMLKGIIGYCRVFVGARMHSVMAGLSTGVPVLALAYSHKASGIMGDFGLSEWVLDASVADREQLESSLDGLLARREELGAHIRARALEARWSAERNLDLVAGLLS